MCGIGGFISSAPLNRAQARRLCTALLYFNEDRGDQSTGIYVNGKLLKKACASNDLTDSDEYFNMFDEDPSYALLHTRQPTCGGRGDAQAQPFWQDNVVTVHNGMYWDTKEIKDKWVIKKKSGVDSELVTSFIKSYGILRLPEFIETTDGPSAIAALIDNRELYFFRHGNPTHYANITLQGDVRVMVFASTNDILMNALRYVWLLPDDMQSHETKPGILYRVTPYKLTAVSERPVEPQFGYTGWSQAYWMDEMREGRYLPPYSETDKGGTSNTYAESKRRKREARLRKLAERKERGARAFTRREGNHGQTVAKK